jgi:tetratricopeptide (TPR) repeat protein
VSFLRRVFSADYRAALAAEAAGNVDLAAERYALAGEHEGAVRMHLARAARAPTRQAEIAALRDALRWAGEDPELRRQAAKALGRAMFEGAKAEGIATERDRTKVREAAAMLAAGEDHLAAGDALEAIGDHQAAAQAYAAGGLVDRMEQALARDEASQQRQREEAEAFASYETHMRVGRRDDARADLGRAITAAEQAGEYRHLLDQLDTALLTAGKVELLRRGRPAVVACAAPKIVLGRDALCDLALRAGGVSRQHAEIDRAGGAFQLRDHDSRNGTTIGGLPLVGRVPLAGKGTFGLGDECTLEFEVERGILRLHVGNGLDRGVALVAGEEGTVLPLDDLGVPLDIAFQRGRPLLGRGGCTEVAFIGEPLGDIRVQLIRGDRIVAAGEEIDVG